MDLLNLIDGPSALIVVGGTLIGTVLRCGLPSCAATLREFVHLTKRKFNADAVRAELAIHIQRIQKDGLLRARPRHFGDAEFDEATDAMIEQRSISALVERHESHKQARLTSTAQATHLLMTAADLAPVFGLAGTLISLNQVSVTSAASASAGLVGAISMAVVTTLYGVLAAHFLFAPLARFLERRSAKEEEERQTLIDWLSLQLQPVCKPTAVSALVRHHAA